MITILKNYCPYCFRKLNKNGDCSKPCSLGAIEIEKKRLQAKIDKQKNKTNNNKVNDNDINKV